MIEEEPQWDYSKNRRINELLEKNTSLTPEETREWSQLQDEWRQYQADTITWTRQRDEAEFLVLDPEEKLLALFRLLQELLAR